jgi:hypothetical protein
MEGFAKKKALLWLWGDLYPLKISLILSFATNTAPYAA